MTYRYATALLLATTVSLAACKSSAPETLPPAPGAAPVSQQPTQTAPTGAEVGTQAHFENAVNGQTVVYFETDSSSIDGEDSAILQQQARYLSQYSTLPVTIEGHADERGTRDYNLALGERRANAAKNYLVSLGISPSRIRTVSYGEERPVATGSNPQAWARNRRAVTVVVNR